MTRPSPASDLQRLLVEEPFVRALARSLAADPDEVVQQTWLHALEQGTACRQDIVHPRSWLRRVVRNVAANLRRGERRRVDREHSVAARDRVPSSAELMEREERRRALVAAVDRLPPSSRTVILLRYFEGLPPRRIAAELGLPVATVWTRLRRGLALLRQRLDAGAGGDLRAWIGPLTTSGLPWSGGLEAAGTGVAASSSAASAVSTATQGIGTALLHTGIIAMTTKTKTVAAAAILLAMAGVYTFWPGGPGVTEHAAGGGAAPAMQSAAGAGTAEGTDPAVVDPVPLDREPVAPPAAARSETGDLVVRVRYAGESGPAADVGLFLRRDVSAADAWRARSDAAGEARFAALPPGRLLLQSDRASSPGVYAGIEAGKTTELEFELRAGLDITGLVVDAGGRPVGGALVEVAPHARGDFYVQVLATTAPDGRFLIREACPFCVIGARAAGHAASKMQLLFGKPGSTAEVRVALAGEGGMVAGIVVDEQGAPVPGAVVSVGRGRAGGIIASDQGAPPAAALAYSDAEGHFRAVGILPGEQPVASRRAGLAPWQGTCNVVARATTPLRITLTRGAVLQGIVRNAAGAPVDRAKVSIGSRWADFTHYATRTTADGSFGFTGLPAGELEVKAERDGLGQGSALARTNPDVPAGCVLTLSRGLELQGRVVDEAGAPIENVALSVGAPQRGGGRWWARARTGSDGRFSVANCPEGVKLDLRLSGVAIRPIVRADVDPRAGALELRARRLAEPTVHIAGRVVDPHGKPVANAMVFASAEERFGGSGMRPTGPDGSFAIGPLVPGSWRVTVRYSAYPSHSTELRRLGAGERWEVGAIQLVEGGTAMVKVADKVPEQLSLGVHALDETFLHTMQQGAGSGRWRTAILAPGEYRLRVGGEETAAQVVPFSIHAGQETEIEVRLEPGICQQIGFTVAAGVGMKDGAVLLLVRRGGSGELVLRCWRRLQDGAPLATQVWLAPGRYEITATAGELRGRGAIVVGERGAAGVSALRIELR